MHQADAKLHVIDTPMSIKNFLVYRQIVQRLRNGELILPESYESISIFISYMTGFSDFVDYNQPLIITNFLNQTFTQFDAIVSVFNVYKVETIGDSYVVSF